MNYTELARFLTELAYPLIAATGVAVARALGMILVTPAFNRLGLTGMIRSAVAVTISLPLIAPLHDTLTSLGDISAIALAAMMLKELMIGVVIGVVFGIPFWAAEVAGELVDLQRGSTMAQIIDPMGETQTGVTSTLLTVTLVALFFMTGGFTTLLDGFYRSYTLWPAATFVPLLSEASALSLLHLLDEIMRVGILMVAPLVIALLIADVALAYLARMAPNLHAFDLSLPIKNLIFAFLVLIYVAFMIPQLVDQLDRSLTNFSRIEAILDATN